MLRVAAQRLCASRAPSLKRGSMLTSGAQFSRISQLRLSTAASQKAGMGGSGLMTMGVLGGLTGLGMWGLGRPLDPSEYSEQEVHRYDDEALPMQYIHRARDRVVDAYKYFAEPAYPELLPEWLPDYQPPYTLCIEYDKILIKQEWTPATGWRVKVRKGAREFLNYLCQYYEIVIFTHSTFMTAEPILNELDKFGAVSYRLYREATRYENNVHVKDLNYLNRDLRRVVMLDTDLSHYVHTPDNGVAIPEWDGNPDDDTLVELVKFFTIMATTGTEDVRPVLNYYRGKDVVATFKANQAAAKAAEAEAEMAVQQQQAKGKSVWSWLSVGKH